MSEQQSQDPADLHFEKMKPIYDSRHICNDHLGKLRECGGYHGLRFYVTALTIGYVCYVFFVTISLASDTPDLVLRIIWIGAAKVCFAFLGRSILGVVLDIADLALNRAIIDRKKAEHPPKGKSE